MKTFPKISKILSVVDTRQYEEGPDGRWLPIPGSGMEHECARCGRFHEVHATVSLEGGSEVVVGTGCMGRDDMEAKKRFQRADRAAKRLAALVAELAAEERAAAEWDAAKAEVLILALPPITKGEHVCTNGKTVSLLLMGDAEVWVHDWCTDTKERESCLLGSWRDNRMAERGLKVSRPNQAWYIKKEIEKVENRLREISG